MFNYFLKRLLGLIPTLLIVAVLVFMFVHLLPGDPARLIAGQDADATVVALVRQELGLDQPLPLQFWHFIVNALQGILVSRWCQDGRYQRRLPRVLCRPCG